MNATGNAMLVLVLCQTAMAQGGADLRFGKIIAAETQPRCFAGPVSPSYEDRLSEGQVVRIGEEVGDFVRVQLPLGVTGYVHKKFASEPVDGMVQTTGSDVSFRYRPVPSEVPALMMPRGAALHWIGEKEDWWRVMHPDAPAYLPKQDVQILASDDAAGAAGWTAFESARRSGWTEAVARRSQAIAAAIAEAECDQKLDALQESVRTESSKPLTEQNFATVQAELAALLPGLAEGSARRSRAEQLGKAVERQQLLVRAQQVVTETPPTRDQAAAILPPDSKDPLARFDAVGWLRFHAGSRGPDYFTLEKGEQILFMVTCASGRYDLRMFDGVEIGIQGAKTRPAMDRIRELDVLRIEVLQLGS